MKKQLLMSTIIAAFLGISLAGLSGTGLAQDAPVDKATVKVPEKHYSPYVGRNIPDRVLWGDTHLHTSLSPDAGLTGTTLGPETAFRFARGEVVTSTGGLKAQLRRTQVSKIYAGDPFAFNGKLDRVTIKLTD